MVVFSLVAKSQCKVADLIRYDGVHVITLNVAKQTTMRIKKEKGSSSDLSLIDIPPKAINHEINISNEQYKRELIAIKIRTENRERKKRWRKLNADRNKDNDLRARLNKRACKLFAKEDSEARRLWLQEEFKKRQEKRYEKERRMNDLKNEGNEHTSSNRATEGPEANTNNVIGRVSDDIQVIEPIEILKAIDKPGVRRNNIKIKKQEIKRQNVVDQNLQYSEISCSTSPLSDDLLGEAMASAAALTGLFNDLNAINGLAAASLKEFGVDFSNAKAENTEFSSFVPMTYQDTNLSKRAIKIEPYTNKFLKKATRSSETELDQSLIEADYPMEAVMTLMHLGAVGTNAVNSNPTGDDDGHRSVTPQPVDCPWNSSPKGHEDDNCWSEDNDEDIDQCEENEMADT
ncbi:hypothetical protein G9A89_004869 [Geosiphon pyriformis]|nr:hypothetical protein G9A89_004869 [Geosiphon pyriformis]